MPSEKSSSRRQELRQKRIRRERTQRVLIVGVVLIVGLALLGLSLYPTIVNATTPVGAFVTPVPHTHPNAKGTSMGDPNAPVKVDLYEDFQCVVCDNYTKDLEEQVIKNYVATGKAYYTFHNFIVIDQNVGGTESRQAANAALCANEQGKFWEYHDMLFTNWNGEGQGAFRNKRLVAFAQSINLDMNQFNSCFNSHKFQSIVDQDIAQGTKLGVTGTPSIFVNGQLLSDYTTITSAIDAALKK